MDKEGEISIGGDRIHFYIEKREIEHHYYNFHIYCLFLLILQNQDLTLNLDLTIFLSKVLATCTRSSTTVFSLRTHVQCKFAFERSSNILHVCIKKVHNLMFIMCFKMIGKSSS